MYNLNTTAARQAEERSGRIAEIGKYVGKFTRAENVTSSKGTVGIDFAFETPDRQNANFTLWTSNAEGKELYGFKQLQSLMTCMSLKKIDVSKAIVRKWDRASNAMADFDGEVFLDLMDKPVGILFETEDYQKFDNGQPNGVGSKVVPAYFFNANTEMTASEILDRKVKPEQLVKLLQTLRHRPLKKAAAAGAARATASDSMPEYTDDDVPF